MGRARRVGLRLLVVGVLAQGAAMIAAATGGGAAAAWLGVVGTTLTMVGALVMGAARAGRLTPWATAAAALVAVLLFAGLAAALLLPPETIAEPLWLGLPRRAAILLLGIGVLPALVLPACYALDFGDPPPEAER